MFRIEIYNCFGSFEAFCLFPSRDLCREWYKGYIYALNPNNNESDFYPYYIEEVSDEI